MPVTEVSFGAVGVGVGLGDDFGAGVDVSPEGSGAVSELVFDPGGLVPVGESDAGLDRSLSAARLFFLRSDRSSSAETGGGGMMKTPVR